MEACNPAVGRIVGFFVALEDYLSKLINSLTSGTRKRMRSIMATHLKNEDLARGNS